MCWSLVVHVFHACLGLCIRLLPRSHCVRQSQRSCVRRSLYFLHVTRAHRSDGPRLQAQDFDFQHFIEMSIRGMDGAALHCSLGTGQDGRLLESTHQHHFFRSASAILPRNFSISPNVGPVCLLPLFTLPIGLHQGQECRLSRLIIQTFTLPSPRQ